MGILNKLRILYFTVQLGLFVPAVWAEENYIRGENPDTLKGLTVEEHLNASLPLDLKFINSDKQTVSLSDFFDGQLPIILSLNYSNCPMLCQMQLNGLVDSLKEIDLQAGKDFQVISVSIDPLETTIRAKETKQKYLRYYGKPGSQDGFHFLVGSQSNIKKLASATGFQYRYVAERKEYAHPAVFMMCTPDGKISRYIYGVEFVAQTIRLSLVEASEGKVGTTVDRILLFCFHYDSAAGNYSPVAINIMKLGGFATVFLLLLFLVPIWLKKSQSKDLDEETDQLPQAT